MVSTKHIPENTVLWRDPLQPRPGTLAIPAGSKVIRDGRRVLLDRTEHAWVFTIRSSRAELGVPDHSLTVAVDGSWAACSCAAAVNRDRCTLVDNPAAILRHHGLLPPADPGGAAPPCDDCEDREGCREYGYECAETPFGNPYPGRRGAVLDRAPADPGGAVGEPPELAGLAECEDAARGERKRRYAESMANLYGG